MKILLTSNGISNESIASALEELVGKPRKEIKIAFIPTAAFPDDDEPHESRDWLAKDIYRIVQFCGFIDIVSLADLSPEHLRTRLEYVDVIFVGGGNAFYLSYMMQTSGLFDLLPDLLKTRVYAGISAGSMIATQSLRTTSQAIENTNDFIAAKYDELGPKGKSAGEAAKLVNFVMRPHYGRVRFSGDPDTTFQGISSELGLPLYAIDDQSAIKVDGKDVSIVSEGNWKLFS